MGKKNTMKSERSRGRIQAKYDIKQRGYKVVIEELKQRLTAKSEKIRYKDKN